MLSGDETIWLPRQEACGLVNDIQSNLRGCFEVFRFDSTWLALIVVLHWVQLEMLALVILGLMGAGRILYNGCTVLIGLDEHIMDLSS